MLRIIEALAGDWRRLDARVEGLSSEIETLARHDKACERLMTVPGIGPIISSAMVTAIGTGDVFPKGRDFGAWLGLVPKQISTGDRTILGSISKRGNRYLRSLFVQAAWVVLVKIGPRNWDRYGLKSWIETAKKRLHHNVLAIALANMAGQARAEMAVETLNVVADRGYYDGEEILACDDAGITVTLPKPLTSGAKAAGRFGKQDFIYLAAEDIYRCPAGERLTYRFTSPGRW